MAYDIIHKNSTVSGTPPAVGEIEVGEIAINAADTELYVKDTAGNVKKFANTDTTGTAAGMQFTQAGSGAVQRTVESKLQDVVSAKDFGAAGNGVTDDLAKIKLALESGKIVDGGGLSYAIDGTLKPTSFKGLRNCTLVQIGDTSSTGIDTLFIEGISNFAIENVNINMGSNVATLFSDDINNGLRISGTTSGSGPSMTAAYVENFTVSNVTVAGNGCGTGIHVRRAKRFTLENCIVRDRVSGSLLDPTNDSQNGFQVNDCANFSVIACQAYNLKTRLSGVDTLKWTRGFLWAEVRDCSISSCVSTLTDQGYDFSGGVEDGVTPTYWEGNRRFTISGCTANSSGTYGFKFANVTHDGLITGCISNNTTGAAFICSSQPTSVSLANNRLRTQALTFTGCKAVNCLTGGWAGVTRAGFYVDEDAAGLYPRSIKFVGCSVIDNQAVSTTVYGFATNVAAIDPYATDHNKDISISAKQCTTSNVTTPYQGIHFPGVSLTGTGAGTTSDSTWTSVEFNATDIYDSSGLHDPASNTENSIIKEAGLYLINSTVVFGTTAAGRRKIRILVNAVSTGLEYTYAAHPTDLTTITASGCLYLTTGDTVRIEIWQDSGGSLSYERDMSFFVMARVA